MEHQKIINSLDNTTNQPSIFRTRNWVGVNDESQGIYNANGDIKFKTSVMRPNLSNYSNAHIHVKATVNVPNTAAAAAPVNYTNKKVIFKKFAPFTNCISKTDNAQVDHAQNIDIVMSIYNLLEYSDVYSKTSGSLWQY